jgi:hypothetical protein
MAKSDVELCNMALARIGITMAITSLDERSKEAMQCKLFFEMTRDKVLGDAPWPFARRTALLQLTGDAPQRWGYSYQYPGDCLRLNDVFPTIPTAMSPDVFRQWAQSNRVAYELGAGEADNQVILTDQVNAVADYTLRITNPLRFDAAFSSAFAWALAGELAVPLAKGVDYARNAYAQYEKEIAMALAKFLNEEGPPAEKPESPFVAARN